MSGKISVLEALPFQGALQAQPLDLAFIVLLGLLALRGFLKGFTGELFSIASIAMAFIASVFFFKNGAAFLRSRYFQMDYIPELLSFLGIFLIVFIAGKIIEHVVKDIIKRMGLRVLDRVLGIFLGAAEAAALFILVLFLLVIQPLFDPLPLLGQSLFVRILLPLMEGFRV